MFRKIKLTNFACHKFVEVDFGPGLTAVKAGVEKGKTTLLKAIAYALFGTKALPDSLDDTVTWGEPVSSLRVELQFQLGGIDYTITRSKGSAELRYGDESVTGQTETAKFVADLLGADASLAANLIIAGQGEIRGSLSGGAKGAVTLIEKLADFDQIDQLIELLQVNLVTGNTGAIKAALEQAQGVLDETEEPAPLDKSALQAEVDTLLEQSKKLKQEADAANAAATAATKARDKGLADTQRQRDLSVKIDDRAEALERLRAEEPALAPWGEVSEGALQVAERDVTELEASVQRLNELRRGTALNEQTTADWGAPDDPDNNRFAGDLRRLLEEVKVAEGAAIQWDTKASAARTEAATKRALILRDACSLCGKDVSDIPEVAARNATLEAEASALDSAALEATVSANAERAYAKTLHSLHAAHLRLQAVEAYGWQVDNAMTPGTLVWIGGRADEGDAYRLQGARDTLKAWRSTQTAREESLRARKAHQQRVERAQGELQAMMDELAHLPPFPDLDGLRDAVLEADQRRQAASNAYVSAVQAHAARSAEVVRLVGNHDKLLAAREAALKAVESKRAELADLEFNNALLKAVREARPVVANKLWALVLGAVTEFFSAMRGQPSQVTRGPEGFLVDGHPVSTLSGSTKDILGLAIRVALTRTFLPGISLLLLDEPNAAMDDERTANVLGFLGGAGFEQIVVVSHDEMTVDVADHIITLE